MGFLFSFLFGCTHSMQNFPGQGSNQSHSSDNTESLSASPPGSSRGQPCFFLFSPYAVSFFLPYCTTTSSAVLWRSGKSGHLALCLMLRERAGVLVVAQQQWIWLVSMRTQVQSLALLSRLRIQCCCELWCRLKVRLRSLIAVAVV